MGSQSVPRLGLGDARTSGGGEADGMVVAAPSVVESQLLGRAHLCGAHGVADIGERQRHYDRVWRQLFIRVEEVAPPLVPSLMLRGRKGRHLRV